MKKALKIAAISITPLVLIIGIVITYSFPSMCENKIIKIATSPDSTNKIVLFERSCGATTGFSSQISIINNNDNLSNESGNIYIAEGYPSNYSMVWISNNSVYITGTSENNFKKVLKFNNINIQYE